MVDPFSFACAVALDAVGLRAARLARNREFPERLPAGIAAAGSTCSAVVDGTATVLADPGQSSLQSGLSGRLR